MPVVMNMVWKGITPEQYEAARSLVNWEGDVPPGGMYHVSSFGEEGLFVTDVWETADDFQRFAEGRLLPGVKQLGLPGEPQVEIRPAHRIFTPAYQPATKRSTTSAA